MAKTKKAGPDETPAGTEPTVTKAEAVREAIRQGFDQPAEGVEFIKTKFGLDVPNQMFSSYKAADKKRSGASSAGIKVGGRGKAGGGDVLEVAKQVKQLVDKHGVGVVSECLELFR